MTKEQLLAQAIRNEMLGLREAMLRAEGEINGLAKVLERLENGSVVAQGPADGSAGGAERPAAPAAEAEGKRAGDEPSGASGVGEEGCTPGTDGGAA